MEEHLLDTSWTIHYIAHSSPSYRSLFTIKPQPNQAQSEQYVNRLTDYLSTHTPQYTDDLDSEKERLGVLRECKWINLTLNPSSSSSTTTTSVSTNDSSILNSRKSSPATTAIHIQLIYQKQTYKFLLLPTIILFKSASTHQKRVFDFLSDNFAVLIDGPLRLPSTLLLASLQDFVNDLSLNTSCDDNDNDSDDERDTETVPDEATRLAILKSGLGTLKLTITFTAAEVAQSLRSVDLDVPYETVYALICTDEYTSATDGGGGSDGARKSSFLEKLQRHIREKTGLVLPLTVSDATSPTPLSSEHVRNNDQIQNGNHDQNVTGANNTTNTNTKPSHTNTTDANFQPSIPNNTQADQQQQPPYRITKLTTSSFALTTEGRIKFSARATESTSDEYATIIRSADLRLLRRIMKFADTKVNE